MHKESYRVPERDFRHVGRDKSEIWNFGGCVTSLTAAFKTDGGRVRHSLGRPTRN